MTNLSLERKMDRMHRRPKPKQKHENTLRFSVVINNIHSSYLYSAWDHKVLQAIILGMWCVCVCVRTCVQSFPLYRPGNSGSERLSYLPEAPQLVCKSVPGPAFLALIPTDPRQLITRMVVQFLENGSSEGDSVCFKDIKRYQLYFSNNSHNDKKKK